MLILAFDTSSKTASVAVLRDDIILYDTIINIGLNHSEVLLNAIEQACIQTRIKITDIDLFACTIGPGSFTGLRIGASTLKGFMLATEKPAVGVSSLAALALNAGKSSKIIYSIMDAGRGQVYGACFKYIANGLLEQIGKEQVLNPSEIKYDYKQEVIFIGDGAVKYADIITGDKNVNIITAPQQYIQASSVGILGREKYDRRELLNAETFVPVYLRSADANKKNTLLEN
jgi:tRNA threonylcarbamoyladenosine biosynthesis protein TsaB